MRLSLEEQLYLQNYYLKLNIDKKIGKQVRNNVDMIFSSGYIKGPKFTNVKSVTSYNGIPDYGLYCLTGTMGNTVHITLTISTKDIDISKLHELCPGSELMDFDI